MKIVRQLFLSLVMLAVAATAMAGMLEKVQKNGSLILGVSEGVTGFSAPDSKGRWVGFDVDMGRAVAAAVLKNLKPSRLYPWLPNRRSLPCLPGRWILFPAPQPGP